MIFLIFFGIGLYGVSFVVGFGFFNVVSVVLIENSVRIIMIIIKKMVNLVFRWLLNISCVSCDLVYCDGILLLLIIVWNLLVMVRKLIFVFGLNVFC